MKNLNLKWLIILLSIIFSNVAFSQDNLDNDFKTLDNDSTYFSISLGYISDAVYLGRKDSITAPYLYPSITYHNKSGFYATGSFSYLTKSDESRIDLFLGTIGYDFTIKKFEGDISFTKYFFNTDSYNVISEVEADFTAMFSYDFKIINLGASAIAFINNSSDSDIFLSSAISHDFVTNNQKFQISPTIEIYFGSQNFYEEYYVNNRFGSGRGSSGQGNGQGTGGTNQTTTTLVLEESEKFDLMAIEFSLPIWYVDNAITLSFSPTLVIPKNPATLTVEDTVYEEDLENTFYWLVGASYKF
ncbi:hypothetical protein MBM09_08060 [Flaviramulus sp. BrNp1-15]|uniref:hypothetical protein n=1 Tax=Flaviramulus sp. BrNp1-15 TaxID=2916754 RepID=UPI001EE97B77|nr:hypothetical protein [Flaviramulus sp. BrNp1-15]ULC57874.1 hypothetical protein MBM09_08060 [Flaviramulus sp. BrNp1-15]